MDADPQPGMSADAMGAGRAGRLAGKVAVVTGGGTGIGRGVADMLARHGARVVLAGRRPGPLAAAAAAIAAAGGVALVVPTDVTVAAQVEGMVERACVAWGGIDVLVSNAGVYPRRVLADLSEDVWDLTIDVNLKGHYLCVKHVVPVMQRRGGGSIIFIGSVHGYTGGADVLGYAAAKGGLWTMTRNLARTFAGQRIRVNYVNPGWVASEGEVAHRHERGESVAWLEEQGRTVVPSGRLQTPQDTAHVCLLLASDDATQITATRFNVDGGLSLVM
jgi:NAD(P)-dependent dehydrogenase (short-subunit alcohol dehydrogenase family)